MKRPLYDHGSCRGCHFLGTFANMDMWVCGETYMMRHSSDGPDYWSNHDFERRLFKEAKTEISGSSCDDDFYHRVVCLRLFIHLIALRMEK